ncbi:MAG: hypothetical protein GY913_30745 [Proteobacteria bacterium]|nr:hypothetical protein [Pseudomonadota bacterium]MCP4921295.1 hypothetical protein [Pseudomonadota bacterium]
MVSALGFSHGAFDPGRPGRLCRGRERWIRAWEQDDLPKLHRVVISGARFSDDSARDAKRGLNCSGVAMGELVLSLFPGSKLVAFREEGELGRVPAAVGEDDEQQFLSPRRGGRWFDPSQRWRLPIESAEQLDELLLDDNVDGFLVDAGDPLSPELEEALYLLSGMGDASLMPARRFQPVGLAEVLSHVDALICVHLDKHGPALAIYTAEPIDLTEAIVAGVEAAGSLAVPFTIPPMLARWDRALQELRVTWMRTREDEFPVPPADEPTRWSRLGRRVAGSQGEE